MILLYLMTSPAAVSTPKSTPPSRVVEDSGGVDVQGVDGDARVPKVLRDHLALLGDPEVAIHGAPRLRHNRLSESEKTKEKKRQDKTGKEKEKKEEEKNRKAKVF